MGAESSSLQNTAASCRACKDSGNKTTDTVKVDLDKIRDGGVRKENFDPNPQLKETAGQKQMREDQEKRAEDEARRRKAEENRAKQEAEQRQAETEMRRRQEEEEALRERQLDLVRRKKEEERRRQIEAEEARKAEEARRALELKRQQAELERQRQEQEQQRLEELEKERQRQEAERERQRLELEKARRAKLQKFLQENGFEAPDEKKKLKGMISSGFTYPLHVAVEAKDAETVELLLWAGADPTLQSSKKQTPLQLAQKLSSKQKGFDRVITLLAPRK